jgi:hypothetical protein
MELFVAATWWGQAARAAGQAGIPLVQALCAAVEITYIPIDQPPWIAVNAGRANAFNVRPAARPRTFASSKWGEGVGTLSNYAGPDARGITDFRNDCTECWLPSLWPQKRPYRAAAAADDALRLPAGQPAKAGAPA